MIKVKNKLLFILAISMSLVVVASNYLVQFPVNYFDLQNFLTYGAFSYPIAFLITDLSNRRYGKNIAKKIVYLGFVLGIFLTFFFSTNYSDLISIRIAIGSGTAFLVAQLIDVNVFDLLRKIKTKPQATQRELAEELGFSLGKLNYCLKALKSKGLIKIENFKKNPNKVNYIYVLTPKGIAEKTKLTINFMKRKMKEYEELKKEIGK